MAPLTRSRNRARTPDRPTDRPQYDTIKRTKFFHDYDRDWPSKDLPTISAANGITDRTGRNWLRQRRELGSPAYRTMRQRSKVLGRRSRVSKETCQMLVSPTRNPVRDQLLEAQIEHHHINVGRRQLTRRLLAETDGGRRYKQAYVQKEISEKNIRNRVTYGKTHVNKTIEDFWQWIIFTDEFHIDPTSMGASYILRERGQRTDEENIQQRPPKQGNQLHVAGWVSWNEKCEKLIFYHDEHEQEQHIEQPLRDPKPRRRPTTESEEEYKQRVLEWEASKPHPVEVKPKGNSMTQIYYADNILPVYISAYEDLEKKRPGPWILQEDNDGSHGTRGKGENVAKTLKQRHDIKTLVHPAQSPDLNPIEACWNIIKPRIRKRTWKTLAELREVVQDEWSKVTMKEIQARIGEMPNRCHRLVKSGGKPIKSNLW